MLPADCRGANPRPGATAEGECGAQGRYFSPEGWLLRALCPPRQGTPLRGCSGKLAGNNPHFFAAGLPLTCTFPGKAPGQIRAILSSAGTWMSLWGNTP